MTKEELMNILRMFETGNEYSGTRMCLSSDNLVVGVFKWDFYPGGNYYWQEPEYMESLDDEYTLLEIAQYIEESMGMSAYWHTVAEDIRLWYDIHYTQQQLIKERRTRTFKERNGIMKVYKMNNGGEWIKFNDGSWRYYPPTSDKRIIIKHTVVKINKR